MNPRLEAPIGILDEHPDWSARLIGELTRQGLPWEKIDHSNHAFDPRDRQPAYSVIVNRSSPSSHTRGHAGVLFYAEAFLAQPSRWGSRSSTPWRRTGSRSRRRYNWASSSSSACVIRVPWS